MSAPSRVVVLGGSAGSLEPIGAALEAVPAESTCAFVVVVHLSPDHESRLAAVLANHCRLPVREVEDCAELAAGTVTVAAPGYHVLFDREGVLRVSDDDKVLHSRPSIDVAFSSAADVLGPRAVGVLFSGASADGAAGLAAIARRGGLAVVQSPRTAKLRVMPEAGVAAAPHARVLEPRAIAELLASTDDAEPRIT